MYPRLPHFARLNISLLFFIPQATTAAMFIGLGDLPDGRVESHAYGISADGSVIVGQSQSANEYGFNVQAFRWTESEGLVGLGFLQTNASFSLARGISADGSVVVGVGELVNEGQMHIGNEAFRWTAAEGMTGIGTLGGVTSTGFVDASGTAASGDGSVIVGGSTSPSGPEAFRWTETEGMVGLGNLTGGLFYSGATAVSADGTVIVGQSISSVGREAFLWTQDSGMQGLGTLEGDLESGAIGISDDGTTIVGWSGTDALSRREASRWTPAGKIQGLGDLDGGGFYSEARDASADGSVIVGRGRTELGDFAAIWDDVNGMRNLQDLLVNVYGFDLTGWNLWVANAVSADGLTITGDGINPDGHSEAWVAKLDPPGADFDRDGTPDEQDNCIEVPNGPFIADAGGNSQLDTNGDGYGNACDPDFNQNSIVDPSDFSVLKAALGSVTAPDQDLNGNGIVDPADFSILKANLGQPPGPSCCAP